RYIAKLVADRSAVPDRIGFAVQDDVLLTRGEQALSLLAGEALRHGDFLGLLAARPALPFADFLVRRAAPGEDRIVPLDTETRTFLHDIPFLRRADADGDPAQSVARLLADRKGIIVEGIGIIASGAMTVEQAYINYSSVFHATFIKYLQDILREGFIFPEEAGAFRAFCEQWLRPLSADGLLFRTGPLLDPGEILTEIAAVGRYTVERGMVDSFFGNISARTANTIYISQTAASLDTLAGCIDPVAIDNSSTAGITASSELLAHRRIYEATDAQVILHGHPRFSVLMSMICEEQGCSVADCWKDCPRVRYLGDIPVVAGEIGAGGLAKSVPAVIGAFGKALVYGHGLFTIGHADFAEAFRNMVDCENLCRAAYFRRMRERVGPEWPEADNC
ncbi:MAG TPA: class II aldolase/adducin family protein, partial [Geobacteraceae bacterium]|nr:class II aldolase/adducin family protein [Geobacteraceae bacterium]